MSPPLDKTAASASGWSRATAFNNLFGPPRNRVPTTTDKHVVGEDVHASSTVAARPVSAQVASRASALNTVKTFLSRVVLTRDDMIAFNGKHFLPDAHVQEMAAILTKQNTPDVQAAMALALKNWPIHTSDQENLVEWYLLLVRADYHRFVIPVLRALWGGTRKTNWPVDESILDLGQVFMKTGMLLLWFFHYFQMPVIDFMEAALKENWTASSSAERAAKSLRRLFKIRTFAIFQQSLQPEMISVAVTELTHKTLLAEFQLGPRGSQVLDSTEGCNSKESILLMQSLSALAAVDLGGPSVMRATARGIEYCIPLFIYSRWMEVDWANGNPIIDNLVHWVENGLKPMVERMMLALHPTNTPNVDAEAKLWLAMAIEELGKARVQKMFSYISWWPGSKGAIMDLKGYMNTPESRIHLTTKFQEEIERRLLHAGATTRQILDVYMLIIQAFTALDSRGVLLDNVSRPIRKYLKGRQDTAGIVIRSMLTDITDAGKEVTEMDISAAIAGEMLKPLTLNPDSQKRYHELDFDSMDYMPQPNDASADFRKNESVNAINHLLSLYDREHFVSTLQDIFGEHLLKIGGDVHFDRETQLLELFKSRFGDEKLQACEVMLRDMTISKRMNAQIHRTRDYMFGSDRQGLRETKLDSQILSRFFWPDLRDDQFAVPAPVKELQSLYEKGFGSRYNLMKLKWLPSLGRVKVALELHDREVREEVPTWVASIIYAFNGGDEKTPTTKTIQQLQDELSMDEALVKNGVSYWITNKVLHETQSGVFSVLETLAHSRTPFAAPTLMHDAVPAVKSAEDKFEENSHIYRQFVQGMLTNRGAMNLATILMMLKMAIPAGFPFGETELRGLLQGMVDEAKLVVQGDVYSVKKA